MSRIAPSRENPAGRRIEELAVQTLGGYQQAARAAMDDDDAPRWGRNSAENAADYTFPHAQHAAQGILQPLVDEDEEYGFLIVAGRPQRPSTLSRAAVSSQSYEFEPSAISRFIQLTMLDLFYGVHLTSDLGRGVNDWSAAMVNTVFQSTIQMANMYNSIYQESIGQVRDPFVLFRQINGPVEFRYHDVQYLRATGRADEDCGSFESGSGLPDNARQLAGITCTPGSRGQNIQIVNNGNPDAAGSWGRLQGLLEEGATLLNPTASIPATVIHLADRAFAGENYPDMTSEILDLSYDSVFLANHEYSHILLSNWTVNIDSVPFPISSTYVARLDGDASYGPSLSDENYLGVGIPSNRAASGTGYPEWAADAVANLAYGAFDLSDPDQRARQELVRVLILDLMIEKGFSAG
jgi:hypothetical protein